MNRLLHAPRAALSSGNHPAIVGLVDGLLYFALNYGVIVGSSALHNRNHPHNTFSPDYAALAVTLAACALIPAIIGSFSTEYVQGEMKNRSVLRSILGTVTSAVIATGAACAIIKPFTDIDISTLDAVQYAGLFGLMAAPFGYRLIGFVKNPNVVTTVITLDGSNQPALGVSDNGETLAVWTPDSNKK